MVERQYIVEVLDYDESTTYRFKDIKKALAYCEELDFHREAFVLKTFVEWE